MLEKKKKANPFERKYIKHYNVSNSISQINVKKNKFFKRNKILNKMFK